MKQAEKTDMLLTLIRERKPMTVAQQLQLTVPQYSSHHRTIISHYNAIHRRVDGR
jgi:hypothetical protein